MNRTVILIILLVGAVGILTYFAVGQSFEQTPLKTEVSETPTPDPALIPDTTLTASPSAILLRIGALQRIDIVVDTGNNMLTTAQVEVAYDPAMVEVQEVEAGSFFAGESEATVLLNEIDRETGKINLALGSLTPKQGRGVLATITIRAIAPTGPTGKPTELTFGPKTQALGSSNLNLESLIKSINGSQIVITAQ